jgi:accessory gene regulator protein AgrB
VQRAALPVALAIVFLLLMVFYLVPGVSHPFVSDNPLGSHAKHAILFAALAVLSLVWARFSTNSAR